MLALNKIKYLNNFVSRHRNGAPVFPKRVNSEGIYSRHNLVDVALITIRSELELFAKRRPEMVPEDLKKLDEIDISSHDVTYEVPHLTIAANGFALAKLSKGGLRDYLLRLKVPTDRSDPEFRSDTISIDPQCIASSICLSGIEKISRNPHAVTGILSFERDILHESLTQWATMSTNQQH